MVNGANHIVRFRLDAERFIAVGRVHPTLGGLLFWQRRDSAETAGARRRPQPAKQGLYMRELCLRLPDEIAYMSYADILHVWLL